MRLLIIRFLRTVLGWRSFRNSKRAQTVRRHAELALLRRTDIFRYRVEHLREMGAKIGDSCRFMPVDIFTEPSLVEIGDNVIMSGEVALLTHDGAVHALSHQIPNVNGNYGRISIGDNSFIGFRAIIMPNVSIGKDCIVAAGSVVFESIPDGCVVIGNPARVAFKTSIYLAMKRESPNTIIDENYAFPKEYPRALLEERIGSLPIRLPHGVRQPTMFGDSQRESA